MLRKLTPKPQCMSLRRAFSTIFSPRIRRMADFQALEQKKMTLLYVLSQAPGREHGFSNRSDGFVSVKRLLSHPEFQFLDMDRLQNIVANDRKHRFTLDFDPKKPDDTWWIRAKQWDELFWVMKPVLKRDPIGNAVYATTLKEWESHISRNGIPRHDREWIEVARGIPTEEYLDNVEGSGQVFIFLNIQKSIRSGIRFFSPTPSGQKWVSHTPLITKGDEAGYIPKSHFSKVEYLTAKKQLLWGNPNPLEHKGWVGYDENDFDEFGERKTYLGVINGLTSFVQDKTLDLSKVPDTQINDLREEAKAVMQKQK